MSAQYNAFSRPDLDASFFDREETQANAEPMFATPVYAQRTKAARSGINPAWIAVPAVALAVGAGAFMMSQRSEPVVASTKPVPAAVAPMVTPTPEVAANTIEPVNPAPAATASASTSGRVMTSQPAPVRVARARAPARTAAVSAATGTGVDASATMPATPQPYSGAAQAQAPAPVVAPPAPTVSAEPAPTPDAATPPLAPQVPDSPTAPPTN
jgi:hypothetical protein